MFATIILTLISVNDLIYAQSAYSNPAWVIDQWDTSDGLPVNGITRIIQSQDGYLWMATHDGLLRFDGIRFKVFNTQTNPELPTNRLTSLHESEDGTLWMETEQNMLIKFKNGVFQHVLRQDGLNGTSVYVLRTDATGRIWIGSDKGISLYENGKLTLFEPDIINEKVDRILVEKNGVIWYREIDSATIWRVDNGSKKPIITNLDLAVFHPMYEDSNGTIWLGISHDIYYFRQDRLYFHTRLDNEAGAAVAIGSDNSDSIWVATHQNGFYRLDADRLTHFEISKGEGYTFHHPFHIGDKNKFWIFARHGIWFESEKVMHVANGISSWTFDHEGNLWIGTVSEGIFRIKPNPFVIYGLAEGLPIDNVYPVLEAQDGTIWVGTHGQGVSRIKNGNVEPFSSVRAQEMSYVKSLHQLKDGTILAAGGYLYELRPGATKFVKVQVAANINLTDISAIYERQDGTLWLGSHSGVFWRNKSDWKALQWESGLFTQSVRFFLDSPDNSLWMATNGAGLARYKNGKLELFGIYDGFPSNMIRSLYIDHSEDSIQSSPEYPLSNNYTLWIGTEDRGLIRLEILNGEPQINSITTYNTSSGMLDYVIHVILQDDHDNFWFNTNRGIFMVPKEQLEALHRGQIGSIKGIFYTERDGLRNREGNGGIQWPGIRASDGKLWLPGQGGLVMIDPGAMSPNSVLPPVIIEEIQVEDRIYWIGSFSKGLQNIGSIFSNTVRSEFHPPSQFQNNIAVPSVRLNPNERDFEIRFTAQSLSAPEKNQFLYRLSGYNETWLDGGGRRSVTYTNIPAGTYFFEVMGSNNTGEWNPEPASVMIVVTPYFYETLWFLVLMVILAGVAIYSGVMLRLRSLKRNEVQLKQLVDERTFLLMQEKLKTEKQAERLLELDRMKSRFFANISHELRTPLTLITGPLSRMFTTKTEKLDHEMRRDFDRMLRNGDQLLRLIDQTLELTRLEHGKVILRIERIETLKFLNRLTGAFKEKCQEKQINLSVQILDNGNENTIDPIVYSDPAKLEIIVSNLLTNAIKFTPSGGDISIELKSDIDHIQISVIDSGIGIQKEELDKIFDRFYQIDSSETRMHDGSGIGLALARELAQLHHGDLTVSSVYGQGSTFILKMKTGYLHFSENEIEQYLDINPISDRDELDDLIDTVAAKSNKTTEMDTAETAHNNGIQCTTILVVEDNADLRGFINDVLSDTWRIIEASNGKEGLERVAVELPDLIIADIMMPEMDGFTFNRTLKESVETAAIPLIFLTAKATTSDKQAGFGEGADDYITKPFEVELLKTRVKNLIDSRLRLRKLLEFERGFTDNIKQNVSGLTKSSDVQRMEYLNQDSFLIETEFDETSRKPKGQIPNFELNTSILSNFDPFLVEVNKIIESHYTDPNFGVAELSVLLYLDRRTVHRRLKQSTGLSPAEYLKKYRMNTAVKLIKSQAGNISEIAYAVGYNSLAYFSYAFREHFGKNPSEYQISENDWSSQDPNISND